MLFLCHLLKCRNTETTKIPRNRSAHKHTITINRRQVLLPPANEVFIGVCQEFCSQGGCLLPRGCLLPGVSAPRGVSAPGGEGAWWRPSRWILLRAVRILLECILIFHDLCQMSERVKFHIKNSSTKMEA